MILGYGERFLGVKAVVIVKKEKTDILGYVLKIRLGVGLFSPP